MRPAFLHLAALTALWTAALGGLMLVCRALFDAPWDAVAWATAWATLAAAIGIHHLAQG